MLYNPHKCSYRLNVMAKKKQGNIVPVVPKRTVGGQHKHKRALYRLRAATLLYNGKTPEQVAVLLNLDLADVKDIIAEIDVEWRDESKELVRKVRGIVVDELFDLLGEYREAWEKSKEPRKISSTKLSDGTASKKREISNRTEERLGNPAFLQGVERVLAQVSDLMGLNAPQKLEHTGQDGKPLIDLGGLSTDQLVALAKSLEG